MVPVFGLAAFAQEDPKAELFLGYEYIRFSPSLSGNPSINFNGGGGAVNFNITKVLGIKAEFTSLADGGNQCACRKGSCGPPLCGIRRCAQRRA